MRQLLCFLLLLPVLGSGQSRIGEWKAHVSLTPVIKVTETSESIVAATVNGIFIVDKKGVLLSSKTKVEGLSDIGITALAYAPDVEILLVGYGNGNLDLLQNDRIVNLPDLTRKLDLPDKTIHRIVCEGNFAYLCCAFGIVKIDLKKQEVAETWYFGSTYELKRVLDLTSFDGRWWVATNRGILTAAKNNLNLQDYRNWQLQTTLPQPDASFTSFALRDGLLYTHDASNDKLLAFNGQNWQQLFPEIKKIREIKSQTSGLLVLTDGGFWLTTKDRANLTASYQPGVTNMSMDPKDALTDRNGTLWVADYHHGLTHQTGTSTFTHLSPNAPVNDQISILKAGSEAVFAATVTIGANGGNQVAVSLYQAGIWQNFTASEDPGLFSIAPITSFAFSKERPDEYWASSAGSGLLLFQKNRVAAHFTELNSTLGTLSGSCIVNGLATDSQNNLWYTNPTGKTRLGYRSASGTFATLPYPGMNFSGSPTGEIIVTLSGTHWVALPDEGLFAFRTKGTVENVTDDQSRKVAVQSRFSNGTTTLVTQFTGISAMAEDRNHELWVGTASGIVRYNDPDKVFEAGEFYGSQPSLDDGQAIFNPILAKEKITSIAIDGGNRKWIGTAHSGVFLFNETGDRLLQHFNSQNSPMLSDQISSMAISPESGEVFFATDRGLISYKSDATEGSTDLKSAYVWPNPLRETFAGNVTIDGLTEGTDVRITDVAGNLIFKSTSVGGRATWDAKNANGDRVSTGVYLIFCTSAQQKISKIIKLLVIH